MGPIMNGIYTNDLSPTIPAKRSATYNYTYTH